MRQYNPDGARNMKKVLIATLAMATVLACPALAQTKHRYSKQHAADRLSAYAAPVPSASRRSPNRSNDAYVNGRYVGFDPDPLVRFNLERDSYSTSTGD